MAFGKFGKYYPDGGSYRAERFDLVAAVRREIDAFSEGDGRVHRISYASDAAEFWVDTDAQHLRYVVVNLLQNAAKYSAPGSAIDVGVTTRMDLPAISVSDEGIGVPESELDELFSPFYRASNVGERPGTGMGLAIVKQSARLIGATVTVTRRAGPGTIFTVTLPGRTGRPPA